MSLVLVKKVLFIIACIGFLLLVNLMAIEFIRNSVDFSPIEPSEKVKEKDKNASNPRIPTSR